MFSCSRLASAFVATLFLLLNAGAAENMIGRQSQNEGMTATPAKGAVVIDGKLDDWDESGRIWVFADQSVRNRYSTEVSSMWDQDYFYLAVKWRDPSPMTSAIDPLFDPSLGWRCDSLQMRVRTPDRTSWFTTWYFTARQQPVFHRAIWKDQRNERNGTDEQIYIAKPGTTELGDGIQMAYKEIDGESAFIQEIRIPWGIIYQNVPEVEAGLVFRMGMEFLWGSASGDKGPVHRYADNMQPGATSREFFWSAHRSWGDITLGAENNIEPRKYVSGADRVEGSIPIRAQIPKTAARFTLAINDADGTRIRNLGGDLLPEDYTIAETGDNRTVEVQWDGLDDHGELVKPGSYTVLGLHHSGIGAEYEMCYYNPGTPPWATASGSGGWGADHTAPYRVAQAGDWMILAWEFAEGGHGIIGVGPDGLKKWGEKRGSHLLAADAEYLYGLPASWHIKAAVLIRMGVKDGAYLPFVKDGKERPFELPVKDILGSDDWTVTDLETTAEHLLLLHQPKAGSDAPANRPEFAKDSKDSPPLEPVRLAYVNKVTGELVRTIDMPPVRSIAVHGDRVYGAGMDACYAVNADGKATKLVLPGLAKPGTLAVDAKGHLLVFDEGPDQQLKAYTPAGKLAYTCGVQGGRPIRGKFLPQAMREVSSIDVDSKGQVWVVEHTNFPRRVSLWDPVDGELIRDYIGNTGYSGTGTFLHDTDPELAYTGPIELKLDREKRQAEVTQILWVPDAAAHESFTIDAGSHAHPQRFAATVNGQQHDYLFVPCYRNFRGYVIFMETPAGWQPVSAITTIGEICGTLNHRGVVTGPLWEEFADLHPYDAAYWHDANGDGKVQRAECTVIQPEKPRGKREQTAIPIPMGSWWGQRITTDFVFYVNGMAQYKPVSFTATGIPVYTPDSLTVTPVDDRGDFNPIPEENRVICLSWKGYAGPTQLSAYDTTTWEQLWRYPNPFPGVHGSHRATMPKPGLLVGPLKIVGIPQVNDQVGRVMLLRGNLGQDFLLTTDGLFVGTMFQDGRLPREELPANEAELLGQPMEAYSNGSEPFNGWFGKQADGKIRLTNGLPHQASMILTVNGLESIRRFEVPALTVSADQIAAADRDNIARAVAAAGATEYHVQQTAKPIAMSGSSRGWEGIQTKLELSRPGYPSKGTVRLTYDETNLYLLYEIEDTSPWVNTGKDITRLFKTGDCVDFHLCVDPVTSAKANRRDPGPFDLRILFSQHEGKPLALLMKPVAPDAPAGAAVDYVSPVVPKHFDLVQRLESAQVKVRNSTTGYTLSAAIPLADIGLKPSKGLRLSADFGFIASDKAGTINTARIYWSNKDTNLVSDLPQESWLFPGTWGTLIFP